MSTMDSPMPRHTPAIAGLLLGGVLLAATVARLTGYATLPAPPPAVASVTLNFADTANGGVAVHNAATGALIANIPARDDGFLRMTLRLLYAYRIRDNALIAAPFTLTEYQDGRMGLLDPATGQKVELEAFGPSNVAEFSNFFAHEAKP